MLCYCFHRDPLLAYGRSAVEIASKSTDMQLKKPDFSESK